MPAKKTCSSAIHPKKATHTLSHIFSSTPTSILPIYNTNSIEIPPKGGILPNASPFGIEKICEDTVEQPYGNNPRLKASHWSTEQSPIRVKGWYKQGSDTKHNEARCLKTGIRVLAGAFSCWTSACFSLCGRAVTCKCSRVSLLAPGPSISNADPTPTLAQSVLFAPGAPRWVHVTWLKGILLFLTFLTNIAFKGLF